MKLIYQSEGYFRFLDFHISHNQLLIRGEKVDNDENIDLVFEGTELIHSPIKFDGIEIYELKPNEIQHLKIENDFNHRVFLIKTSNKNYHIKCSTLRIYKNSLDLFESSIDMTGNGQKNLLWISKD